jgi:hypothetical protein
MRMVLPRAVAGLFTRRLLAARALAFVAQPIGMPADEQSGVTALARIAARPCADAGRREVGRVPTSRRGNLYQPWCA